MRSRVPGKDEADDELFKAWCRALETRIELMGREHVRDMKAMEARLQELSEAIRCLTESVRDITEP